jgi:hypothetical protein
MARSSHYSSKKKQEQAQTIKPRSPLLLFKKKARPPTFLI